MQIHQQLSSGLTYRDPWSHQKLIRHNDGFVDDVTNMTNCFDQQLANGSYDLRQDVTYATQTWADLLHTTGGKLELLKCFVYLLNWLFSEDGSPILQHLPGESIHIKDPQTGKSAQGVQSASILASLAVDTDALSTTVFVLGVERGLELVNSLPGVDAIIIDGAGKLHYSAELLMSVER